METENNKLTNQLAEILEKNKEAERGYAKAAENTKNQGLKNLLLKRSNERRDFNLRLKRELVDNFDDIDSEGKFTGSFRRAWMDAKSLLGANNDEAILEEAIRGDKAALEEYEELVEEVDLPIMLGQIILNQMIKIRKDLAQIKTLEDLVD